MALLKGATNKNDRQFAFKNCRIFFGTPQTLQGEFERKSISPENFALVIFDEAHRAQGAYAYCHVVKLIAAVTRQFRVIGLSATPGANPEKIQSILYNLLISKVERREEEDLEDYLHHTEIENIVVPPSADIVQFRLQLNKVKKKKQKKINK